jgi:hypothetical protein
MALGRVLLSQRDATIVAFEVKVGVAFGDLFSSSLQHIACVENLLARRGEQRNEMKKIRRAIRKRKKYLC